MSAQKVESALAIARGNFSQVAELYRARNVYERYPVGHIWHVNLSRHLQRAISECPTAKEAIGILNDKAFFDINAPAALTVQAISWHLAAISRDHGLLMDDFPPDIQESSLVHDDVCVQDGSRRLSTDFLWRLNYTLRVARSVPFPQGRFTMMELGSGYGAFTRLFKLLNPESRCVLIDLPESLFFAEVFLRGNFPEARFHYVHHEDDAASVPEDADFVLVPQEFAPALGGLEVFFFTNQNSLGEMENAVQAHWVDLLERVYRPRYLFSLNRFLNNIKSPDQDWRRQFNATQFHWSPGWEVLDWEVDPGFERCPCYSTLFTRNLHMVACWNPEPPAAPDDIEDLLAHDWATRPYWAGWALKQDGPYPPMMSRSYRELTPDLATGGTLFRLWDHLRHSRAAGAHHLLAAYLTSLGGIEKPFEEVLYLVEEAAALEASECAQSEAAEGGTDEDHQG